MYGTVCSTTRANGTVVLRENVQTTQQSQAQNDSVRSNTVSGDQHRQKSPYQAHLSSSASPSKRRRTEPHPVSAAGHHFDHTSVRKSSSPGTSGYPTPSDSRTDKVPDSVVTIEPVPFPKRSKYAGKNSTQVLAKSAEELFQDDDVRIDVMKFFCPLMSFAEEIPMPVTKLSPLIDQVQAEKYAKGMSVFSPHEASLTNWVQHSSLPSTPCTPF